MVPKSPAFHSLSVMETRETGRLKVFHAYRDGRQGLLMTREYSEHLVDGRSLKGMKPVGWEERVPEGADLFPASGGTMPGNFKTFWVGWFEGVSAKALALTQESPLAAATLPGDRFLHPPVLGWDQKLKWYFFRREGVGFSLWKHEFSGLLRQPGRVATVKVLDLPYEPLHPVVKPVPIGMEGFVDRGEAVVAWVSTRGGDTRAHVLWIKGKTLDSAASDPIPGYRPFAAQRADVWSNGTGKVRMGWTLERPDLDQARSAEWVVDFATRHDSLLLGSQGHVASTLRSAATVLNRVEDPGMSDIFYLSKAGKLYQETDRGLRLLRDGVPPDYDFPIVSGPESYEARRDSDGVVVFEPPGP